MRMLKLWLFAVATFGLAASTGCSKDPESSEAPAASQGNEAPPAPLTGTTPVTKLTDGQIAQILSTADAAEVEQARIALSKSNDAQVRAFASHIVDQHTASKQAGAQLAASGKIEPAPSPMSTNLKAKSDQVVERLNAADAATFDDTYMASQIEQHAEVLKIIDEQLQPATNDPSLRDHLATARGIVQEHLERARQIQK